MAHVTINQKTITNKGNYTNREGVRDAPATESMDGRFRFLQGKSLENLS